MTILWQLIFFKLTIKLFLISNPPVGGFVDFTLWYYRCVKNNRLAVGLKVQQYKNSVRQYCFVLHQYKNSVRQYCFGLHQYKNSVRQYCFGLHQYKNSVRQYCFGLHQYKNSVQQYCFGLHLYKNSVQQTQRTLNDGMDVKIQTKTIINKFFLNQISILWEL